MSIKQDRMGGRIRQILSELLLREVSDPRLYGLTVTEVELDLEMQYAKVWVNALGEEERQKEVMLALAHANGFLRREVGKRVRLRKTPELFFIWDASLDRGERINQLISELDIPPEDDDDQRD
ncbi:MAG: 30S ribosome-binding factor RbfA [Chloroflexi bacterium]|nr:30S ribosome-binding factor RbfA [Chloroflexota bacterium]